MRHASETEMVSNTTRREIEMLWQAICNHENERTNKVQNPSAAPMSQADAAVWEDPLPATKSNGLPPPLPSLSDARSVAPDEVVDAASEDVELVAAVVLSAVVSTDDVVAAAVVSAVVVSSAEVEEASVDAAVLVASAVVLVPATMVVPASVVWLESSRVLLC